MNVIKEKENNFLKLISDIVTDIVGGKKIFTPTNLKIKYEFKNMSKIKVSVFYDNGVSENNDKESNIVSFLVTPENKLTDLYVNFENCTNFDLKKENLEKIDLKVKEKIDSLFKMSDLTYAKVRVLTGNEKKKSLDKFLDLLNVALEDIFKDSDTKPWAINGEIYSVPNRILIKVILENGSLFLENGSLLYCYVSHDNKVSVCTYRLGVRRPVNGDLERKLPSLLENSGLDFKKLNKIAQKMAEERAVSFDNTLVTDRRHKSVEKVEAPSKEFEKFKKFEKLLDEFLQKIAEDYDGLQISINSINYSYPARIEVRAKNKNKNNKNIDLDEDEYTLYCNEPDFDRALAIDDRSLKIISFNMNPYVHPYILDVDVSLEKCLSNGVSYGDLQEEDVKVRKALPELLLKADLHFSDVEKWTSLEFEYPRYLGTDGFEKHLYSYLSQFDIINSDLLQYMYFGCAKSKDDDGITVDVFSSDPWDTEPKALLRFNYEDEDYTSVEIGCELIKNYKRLSAKKYREVLDVLNVIKKEIVFLLKYYGLSYGYWDGGFPSYDASLLEDEMFDDMVTYNDYIDSLYIFNEGSLGDNVHGFNDFYVYGSADEFESIEDTNDEG